MSWGFFSHVLLLGPILLGSFCTTTLAEEPADQLLPTWRIQGSLFSGFGSALGVYRGLSNRWDVGLELSTDFSNSDDEDDSVSMSPDGRIIERSSSSDSDTFSVQLAGELRRWGRIGEKLAWYIGPRVRGGIGKSSNTRESLDIFGADVIERINKSESRSVSAATGLVLGADLQLLKGLSATFALFPAEAVYSWGDRDDEEIEIRNGETGTRRGDSDSNTFRVETDLTPILYLTLSID